MIDKIAVLCSFTDLIWISKALFFRLVEQSIFTGISYTSKERNLGFQMYSQKKKTLGVAMDTNLLSNM